MSFNFITQNKQKDNSRVELGNKRGQKSHLKHRG